MDDDALWIWRRLGNFERNRIDERKPYDLFAGMSNTMQADVRRILPRIISWLGELEERCCAAEEAGALAKAQQRALLAEDAVRRLTEDLRERGALIAAMRAKWTNYEDALATAYASIAELRGEIEQLRAEAALRGPARAIRRPVPAATTPAADTEGDGQVIVRSGSAPTGEPGR